VCYNRITIKEGMRMNDYKYLVDLEDVIEVYGDISLVEGIITHLDISLSGMIFNMFIEPEEGDYYDIFPKMKDVRMIYEIVEGVLGVDTFRECFNSNVCLIYKGISLIAIGNQSNDRYIFVKE
jgi:hypothetical protein